MQAYAAIRARSPSVPRPILKSTGVADTAYFGPEPEFFIFDSVRWQNDMGRVFYEIGSEEAAWSSRYKYDEGNTRPSPRREGRLLPGQPGRFAGRPTRGNVQGARVAGPDGRSASPRSRQRRPVRDRHALQYAGEEGRRSDHDEVRDQATSPTQNGKTATFMPKPIVGDNGSGMHVHQSLSKDGKNLFAGELYGGLLADRAVVHRRHLQACARDQRVRQLHHQQLQAPGAGLRGTGDAGLFGPQPLGAAAASRTWPVPRAAASRCASPIRMQSGYLTFTALMMAGLDGILNKIDPGAPTDKDLYDLPPEEEKNIPQVCASPRRGARCAGQGSRIPQGRRRVQRRLHRRLHRAEDEGSHGLPRVHPSARIPDVLQHLTCRRPALSHGAGRTRSGEKWVPRATRTV